MNPLSNFVSAPIPELPGRKDRRFCSTRLKAVRSENVSPSPREIPARNPWKLDPVVSPETKGSSGACSRKPISIKDIILEQQRQKENEEKEKLRKAATKTSEPSRHRNHSHNSAPESPRHQHLSRPHQGPGRFREAGGQATAPRKGNLLESHVSSDHGNRRGQTSKQQQKPFHGNRSLTSRHHNRRNERKSPERKFNSRNRGHQKSRHCDRTSSTPNNSNGRRPRRNARPSSPVSYLSTSSLPSSSNSYLLDSILASEEEYISLEERAKYVSLDCEMVGVGPFGQSSALARVSIVDWDGAVLLDTYVKVTEPVTDFRTFVSGVREEDLRSDRAMDADKCRALVQSILGGKILIGHGLSNDLDALRITHPWYDTRDTAMYAPYMMPCVTAAPVPSNIGGGIGLGSNGCPSVIESDCSSTTSSSSSSSFEGPQPAPPSPATMTFRSRKLKELAMERLGITIQVEGKEHSPIEDARAALGLYKIARTDWEQVMEYKIIRSKEIENEAAE